MKYRVIKTSKNVPYPYRIEYTLMGIWITLDSYKHGTFNSLEKALSYIYDLKHPEPSEKITIVSEVL